MPSGHAMARSVSRGDRRRANMRSTAGSTASPKFPEGIARTTGGVSQSTQVDLGRTAPDADDEESIPRGAGGLEGAVDGVDLAVGDDEHIGGFVAAEGEGGFQRRGHFGAAEIGVEFTDPALRRDASGVRHGPHPACPVFDDGAEPGEREAIALPHLPDDVLKGATRSLDAVARHGAGAVDEDLDRDVPGAVGGNARAEADEGHEAFGVDAIPASDRRRRGRVDRRTARSRDRARRAGRATR